MKNENIFKIEFTLSQSQASALEQMARNKGQSTAEVLGEITNKAQAYLLEELNSIPWVSEVSISEKDLSTERRLKELAYLHEISQTVLENRLMGSAPKKYCHDLRVLRDYQKYIRRKRAA